MKTHALLYAALLSVLAIACRGERPALGRDYRQFDWSSAQVSGQFVGNPGFVGHRWIEGSRAIGYNIQLSRPIDLNGNRYEFVDVYGVNVPDLENGRLVEVHLVDEDRIMIRVLSGNRHR